MHMADALVSARRFRRMAPPLSGGDVYSQVSKI